MQATHKATTGQAGLPGKAISPRLYIGVGVSGQPYHVVGIQRSGLIVGINRNVRSAIMKLADIGLVGDWAVIVPLLTEALAAAKRARQVPDA